jgi:hypothetical protein
MIVENNTWILIAGGAFSGLLAGLLGIGGGTVIVPILVALGYQPVQTVATSSLAIVITSISGSLQNWRMGYLNFRKVTYLAIPSLITAQIGVYLASRIPGYLLLTAFGFLLLLNIYLANLRRQINKRKESTNVSKINPVAARILTGSTAGILAGLFGVGGGVIMVPLQMLLLGESIKVAIQTSLGVIVITSIAACLGHTYAGNILVREGIILGFGGLIGAQITTRFLPKLPDKFVSLAFQTMLIILAIYCFWQAWVNYYR